MLDNGARQNIQIFSITSNEPLSRLPAPLSPNTYTNRMPGIGDAPSNITVLLLDALNTPLSDQAFANQRLVKFLEALQPHDRIAIYSLTRRLRMLHDFTSDASSLIAALKGYKGQLSELDDAEAPDLGYTGNPMAALLSRDLSQEEAEWSLSDRIELTLQAMTENVRYVNRDVKIQFRKLNFVGPPVAKNTRKATARSVGANSSHSLATSTLTASRSFSMARL